MAENQPRRGRPRKSLEPDGRDRLLLAARSEFSRAGFSAANVNDIARAAEVNPPTLYHHFTNKDGLFIATAAQAYTAVLGELSRAVDEASDGYEEAIDAVLTASIALVTTEPSLARMFLVIQYEVPRHPTLEQALLPQLREFRGFFDRLAQRAPGGAASPFTGRALVALLNGLNTEALLMASPERDYPSLVQATKALIGID
ncbi:TetR/AcrR family transcriptional regulator [Gordonia sp. TBRC 11910]|uniref:TetR/AcrR family transcriptional regulator n=1 Tax=Gordonia asplenii TaxID=2725283 RepID=A0A848KTC1_9ACTN|nr:TetR/AcrR family transcriptional regulator [Gordonia asplenii]NMO01419.1 TetR/AcrR family transcriptional regulator [Gordonia asplenii]